MYSEDNFQEKIDLIVFEKGDIKFAVEKKYFQSVASKPPEILAYNKLFATFDKMIIFLLDIFSCLWDHPLRTDSQYDAVSIFEIYIDKKLRMFAIRIDRVLGERKLAINKFITEDRVINKELIRGYANYNEENILLLDLISLYRKFVK